MAANLPGLSLDNAEKIVQLRDAQPWKTLDAAATSINSVLKGSGSGPNSPEVNINSTQFILNSNYFLVIGRIRYDSLIFTERSVLQRNNQQINILWREKRAS
jgi:type II secretory pathway component PulK